MDSFSKRDGTQGVWRLDAAPQDNGCTPGFIRAVFFHVRYLRFGRSGEPCRCQCLSGCLCEVSKQSGSLRASPGAHALDQLAAVASGRDARRCRYRADDAAPVGLDRHADGDRHPRLVSQSCFRTGSGSVTVARLGVGSASFSSPP